MNQKRRPGRPRVRPEGSANVSVPLSRTEADAVAEAAKSAGQSSAQWMRRTLLVAAAFRTNKWDILETLRLEAEAQ